VRDSDPKTSGEIPLRQTIQKEAVDGRVSCRFLLNLADRTGTSPKRIGQLCNEMNLRIIHCQLGCFG